MDYIIPDIEISDATISTLTKIVNLIPGGFFICEGYGDGVIQYANEGMLACLGYASFAELLQEQASINNLICSEDLPDFWNITKQKVNTYHKLELRMVGRDKSIYYLEANACHVLTEIYGDAICCFFMDITEKKRSELALAQNRDIIMGLNRGYTTIWVVDLENNTMLPYHVSDSISHITREMSQYEQSFMEGMEVYAKKNVHPEDQASFLQEMNPQIIKERIKRDNVYGIYFRRLLPSGNIEDFKVTIGGLNDECKKAILGFKPISKQVRVIQRRAEAKRTDELMRAALEDYICVCDIDSKTGEFLSFFSKQGQALKEILCPNGTENSFAISSEKLNSLVMPMESRATFGEKNTLPYIKKQLKKEKQYIIDFDILLDGEIRRLQFTHSLGAVTAENQRILIGVRDITEQERQRLQNTRLLEEQMAQLSHLASMFYSVYYIDLEKNTFRETAPNQFIPEERLARYGSASERMERLNDSWYIGSEPEKFRAFSNLDTMAERLMEHDYVSMQCEGMYSGWVEIYIIAGERDENRRVKYVFWAVQSIEETKRRELESQASLTELRDVIAAYDMGTWRIELPDLSKPRMYVDEKMGYLLGIHNQKFSPEEIYEHWFGQVKKDELPKLSDCLEKMKSGHRDEVTFVWNHPYFGERYVRCGGTALQTEEGYVLRGYHTDVTNMVEAEQKQKQALADALGAAQRANHAKSTFLFNMSHDIRTPMNAILGYADLMERHEEDIELQRRYVKNIQTSGKYLLDLINNVLEMSRIESGNLTLSEEVNSVEDISRSIAVVFGDEYEKHNLEVERHIELKYPYVYVDLTKTREIFLNIVSNSVKYTPPGGKIFVTITDEASPIPGYVNTKIVIRDTGIGMSKEFLPHIFDTFVREKTVTESKIVGTGLGMGIVKKYIDLMDGTIEIESELGKGTKTTVILPLRIASSEDMNLQHKDQTDISSFEGKRILLAEDNDLNAEIAMELLAELGFLVERAEDGQICLDKVIQSDSGYYDLILMDIQMPHMDGFEATSQIRRLKERSKHSIPIVAMTANAFEEDRRSAFRSGMNGFVAKPIEIPKLVKALSDALRD